MSRAHSLPIKRLLALLPNIILLFGLIFLLGALVSYYQITRVQASKLTGNEKLIANATLLTERQLAVTEAIKKGEKTYTFTSNYTPGLGRINDPAAYERTWIENLRQAHPQLKEIPAIGNHLQK